MDLLQKFSKFASSFFLGGGGAEEEKMGGSRHAKKIIFHSITSYDKLSTAYIIPIRIIFCASWKIKLICLAQKQKLLQNQILLLLIFTSASVPSVWTSIFSYWLSYGIYDEHRWKILFCRKLTSGPQCNSLKWPRLKIRTGSSFKNNWLWTNKIFIFYATAINFYSLTSNLTSILIPFLLYFQWFMLAWKAIVQLCSFFAWIFLNSIPVLLKGHLPMSLIPMASLVAIMDRVGLRQSKAEDRLTLAITASDLLSY